MNEIRFFPGFGDLSDEAFHNIFEGDDTLDATKLIGDDSVLDTCLLEEGESVVDALVFGEIACRAEDVGEGEVVMGEMEEEVFEENDATEVVETFGGDRVDIEEAGLYFVTYVERGVIEVEPDQLVAVCHDGSQVPVAEVKDASYDILFDFLYFSFIPTFFDDGFNFIFGDMVTTAMM